MDLNLPTNVEFSIHAASLAIQSLDRVELERGIYRAFTSKSIRSSDVLWHHEGSRH